MFWPDVNDAQNISDLREMAKSRLPKWLFEFVDRGTEDEVAVKNNRDAFDSVKLVPRTLVDVSARNLETTIFGKPQKMPVAIAPTGVAGMLWYQGELELAHAAKEAGIPFTLSTGSITPMEKIASEVGGTLWMQLYMWADRSLSLQLVKRAAQAGFEALFVTVDGVVAGNREHNRKNGYAVPFRYNRKNSLDVLRHPGWLTGVLARYLLNGGMPKRENFPEELRRKITSAYGEKKKIRSDTLSWDDLKALRDAWPGKLVVKGILHPDDAEKSVEFGADGVVVSNHGGRNCDVCPSSIEVLPEIVAAVGHKTTVFMDSGVRRGTDVAKALALGAKCVLLGRSPLYGIAAQGEKGAARALAIYRSEMMRIMAQMGCRDWNEVHNDSAVRVPPQWAEKPSRTTLVKRVA